MSSILLANSVSTSAVVYDTASVIDVNHRNRSVSPIDEFLYNAEEINKLLSMTNPSPILGNLIILGYVSAVESYLRTIIRKLIIDDEFSKIKCENLQIFYGSVLSNTKDMLPEALFEDKSLAGKKNIYESLRSFLDISIQDSELPHNLLESLKHFDEICELRHCIVHRFGRFGSKNAIKLGLYRLSNHVEKPIRCDYPSLQTIIQICQNTVKLLNNFLYSKILDRLCRSNTQNVTVLVWDYKRDRKLFKKYYDIFYSKTNSPVPDMSLKKSYDLYMGLKKES